MWPWSSAGARVLRFLLQRTLPHPHHAVDLAPLLHLQAPRREVTVDDAGRLNLDPLLGADTAAHFPARSEEHTSELQSPCNLVCRLLLEKKKFEDHRTS